MAAVAYIELPRTQQPPPYTPLDATSPINDALCVLVYGGAQARLRGPVVSGIDVRTGQEPLQLVTGSPVIRPHQDGFGPVFAGGGQQYSAGLVGDVGGTGPFTIEVLVRITSAPVLSGFFGLPPISGDGAGRAILAYGGGSNKNIFFWGGSADLASGVDWREDGSLQHVFVASEGSGQPIWFYRDGAQIASGTTPTLASTGNTSYFVGDAGNGWASSPTGAIVKAAHYRRALTPGEVRLLTDDPWANFESLRLPISFTASAPSAPTLTAASAVNITGTSFRPRVTFTR